MKKENWRKQLKEEFGIHFKDNPDELKFLEAFVEDLLNKQKEENKKKETIKERLITLGIGTIAIIIVLGFIILVNFYLYNKTI